MSNELIARVAAAWAFFARTYWSIFTGMWGLVFIVALLSGAGETTRNHAFVVFVLHMATRDILAAMKARP